MRYVSFLTSILLLMPTAVSGADDLVGKQSLISLGGKLYDNHWLQSGRKPPSERYQNYPAEIDVPAAHTWRCVSCHGWDYRGASGQLGQTAKSPLFVSLRNSAGKPVEEIARVITSGRHRLIVEVLKPDQIHALSWFISIGQHDIEDALDGGRATGSAERGKDIFEGVCVSCHQQDGKAYIEGELGDKPALGWVATNRPAQALHKIRNGVPGTDMLSLRFLPQRRVIDLLSYLQTLDAEAP